MRRTFWVLTMATLVTLLLSTGNAEAAGNSITAPDIGADVGQHTSMVRDGSGNPVIAYYDATTGDLKVVRCFDAGCTSVSIATPFTGTDLGQYPSLVLDASGYPVISFYDATAGDLVVLHCGNANCTSGNVSVAFDTAGDVGAFTSLALDGGNPVVSYYDVTNGNLKVARCNGPDCTGGGWIALADSADVVGQYTSLALDASGYPVVSYYDVTNGNLKVLHCNDAICDGVGESITSPDSGNVVGSHSSLALVAGNPVVSYYDVTNGNLKVLHCNDANCAGSNESITSPDTVGIVGAYTSLELDGSNNPVISYYDLDDANLKVLHCDDVNCGDDESGHITSPDTTGVVGQYTSLIMYSGNPTVGYYDATHGQLKVLRCGDANCTSANSVARPDVGGDVGAHTWLALDGSGRPVVSYQDVANNDLKVMRCNDANCAGNDESIASPDTAGAVGPDTSLALDASSRPVVSYYDIGNGDLKVLHCGNDNCTSGNSITSPDGATSDVGWYTALALDASGNPVVSYTDNSNVDLKVMHCNDPNCDPTPGPPTNGPESIKSPDTAGDVGRDTWLALDASGNPVVSYYDQTNGDLKVLHCTDPNCDPALPPGNGPESIKSPDTAGYVGAFTSLVLDASGNPVISYYDGTNADLKVMHCTDPNCDPAVNGGEIMNSPDTTVSGIWLFTSLKLDAAGNPVVSYFDSSNQDLKLLHCNEPNCAPGGDSITFVDTVGSVGHDNSLALDSSGRPVVTYRDWTNGDLKVLHCDTANCTAPASYPPAGTDEMPVSLHFANVWLDEDDNGVPETPVGAVTFSGTGKFSRGTPYPSGGYNTIDTAITSMVLTGTVAGYSVTIKAGTEQGLPASPGKIRERTPGTLYPADTWFDLLFEVDSADPDYGTLWNCNGQSVRLNGVTMAIPAAGVDYLVPSCPLAPPPASCAVACQGGGLLGDGEVMPMSPMRMCTGYDPAGNAIWVSVGGIAEWPGTAARPDSLADSSAGSGFNYTALGAALGAVAVALAAGAWFARRRWTR